MSTTRSTKKDGKEKGDDSKEGELSLKDLVISMRTSLEGKIDKLTQTIEKIDQDHSKTLKQLDQFAESLNLREQHSRNQSLRINGLQIDDITSKDALLTSHHVYKSLLHPILMLSVKDNLITEVPSLHNLIEYCHCLPSNQKNDGNKSPPQIIVRLHSRLFRHMILKNKRSFLREKGETTIFISEDLTRINFKRLMDLKKDPSTLSAWSASGKLFYKTRENPNIKKKFNP